MHIDGKAKGTILWFGPCVNVEWLPLKH